MSRTKPPVRKAGKESRVSATETPAKKEQRGAVRENLLDFQGLCPICWKVESCEFFHDTQRPVLECDEFRPQEDISSAEKSAKSRPGFRAGFRDSAIGKYKGLCVNCEIRAVCVLPKPEEGVWRCEEYK